ncbi:MAG: hypothetical protein J6D11_03090 [Clostridia bacterium]|nr:hypothetical protein [Clostridia bacterium]
MKKFIAFLLSLSLLVCIVSCNNSEATTENTVQTSSTSKTESTTTANLSPIKNTAFDGETEFGYAVRTHSVFEESLEEDCRFIVPEPVWVSSVSDLVLPRMHPEISPKSVYERYDEEFFKENFLYIYQFVGGSSVGLPYIKNIEITKGEKITLTKRTYYEDPNGPFPDDIVCWILFIPIPRQLADGTEEIIFN